MKKHFITGLVILLPVALTIFIVHFLFNLLTEPFVGIVQSILGYYGHLEIGFSIFTSQQVQNFVSQIVILALLFLFTLCLGLLARWFFFHYLVRFWEYLVKKIPVVSTIYMTCKDVIQNIFKTKSNSFKQVVLVPFPTSKSLTIGFITNDSVTIAALGNKQLLTVFVPTTPNPTSGFLMLCEHSDLVYLDMKIDEAFKYIISCGTVSFPRDKTLEQ